ncbi:MAG: hypothetical protein CL677_06800 [Bdellovibrionaceae bacterium]|nr:hypothetical protein [Pseudobdellovibrionaceae bacterium]|tara:strand:+ start:55992 stop:57050 length:1059 start_codon:yes stop_codon:yes gene_type:complete
MKNSIVILLIVGLANLAFANSDGITVGGFVDAGYEMNPGFLETTSAGAGEAGENNRFLVNQGAFYFSKSSENGSMHIDMPFVQNSTSGSLTFATGMAQAYVVRNLGDYKLTFGQFDTIFGFEANDSIDVFYARNGAVFGIMPVTHTGATFAGKINDSIEYTVLVGNSASTGAQSGEQADETDPEMGLKFAYSSSQFRASLGVLSTGYSDSGCGTADCGSQMLIDLLLGKDFGKFSVDLAVDQITNPGGDASDASEAILGILIDTRYNMNSEHAFGLRLEQVTGQSSIADLPTTTVDPEEASHTQITLGYSHKCDSDLTLKVSLESNTIVYASGSGIEDPAWTEGQVSALFKF